MANSVFPQPVTLAGYPATCSDPIVLRAALAPTASYVATTNAGIALGWDFVVFHVIYTAGNGTALDIKPEGSPDGTNWYPMTYKATQASGESILTLDILEVAGTLTFSTPPCSTAGFQLVRCSVLEAGWSSGGSVAITATAGIGAAGSRRL